jgi:uncharacterized protein (TIGR02145 family)
MKVAKKFYYCSFTLLGATLMLLNGCEKGDEAKVPVLTTADVTEITQTTAMSGGNITDVGGTIVTARGVCWNTSQNPNISDSKTEDGAGAGSFTSSISGLEPNTTYYVRAYATNSAGTGYGSAMTFTSLEEAIRAVDVDGNVYSTVIIGNLEWFAENLRTTKYNNGTPIPNVTSDSDWSSIRTGAYSWKDNDETTYKNTYGALYNWYAVNTGNLCPAGWHVPTDVEWTALTDYAGGASIAGGKLKSTRTAPDAHPCWISPNTSATDEYGFSALPGGHRDGSGYGMFDVVGRFGDWWSSTESHVERAWIRRMVYNNEDVRRFHDWKVQGSSVRCVRD